MASYSEFLLSVYNKLWGKQLTLDAYQWALSKEKRSWSLSVRRWLVSPRFSLLQHLYRSALSKQRAVHCLGRQHNHAQGPSRADSENLDWPVCLSTWPDIGLKFKKILRKSLIDSRDMKFSLICLWNFPEDRSSRMSSYSSVIWCVGHFGPFQSVTPAYFALSLTIFNYFWLIMKSCSSLHDHIKWIIASWYFYLDIFQTQISFPALTLIFSDTCKYCIVSTSSQWREAGGLGPAPTKRRKQM